MKSKHCGTTFHYLLHTPLPFGIGNLDEVNAAWQVCHVDLQFVAGAVNAYDMLPKHIDYLGTAKLLAHDGELAAGGIRRNGDAVGRGCFANACDVRRSANGLRFLIAVNRCDAIFNINSFREFGVSKIGLESVGDFGYQVAIAIDAVLI